MENNQPKELKAQQAFEADPVNRLIVPKRLASPGRLVTLSARILKKAKPGRYGRLSSRREDCLDLSVSPAQLGRALRLMDGLIKGLDQRGFEVSSERKLGGATTVTVLGQAVEFGLDEVVQRSDHQPTKAELKRQADWSWRTYPAYDYRPTGRLRLTIKEFWPEGSQKRWVDGRYGLVEDQLNKFMVGLVRTALGLRAKAEEREAQKRAWEERQAQAMAIKEAQERERARRGALASQAEQWAKATNIRAFVSAVSQTDLAASSDQNQQRRAWVAWALEVADGLDPIGKGIEHFLKELQQGQEPERTDP